MREYLCDCQYAGCPERHLTWPAAFDELEEAIEKEDIKGCEKAIEELNDLRRHDGWPDFAEKEFSRLESKYEELQFKYYCHYCDAVNNTVIDYTCKMCKLGLFNMGVANETTKITAS